MCFKFLTNNSWIELLALIIECVRKRGDQIYQLFKNINRFLIPEHSGKIFETAKKIYQNHIAPKMARYRRNTYQLSAEYQVTDTEGTNPRFAREHTPISDTDINFSHSTSSVYGNADESLVTLTSIPLLYSDHRGKQNFYEDHDTRIPSPTTLGKSPCLFSNNQNVLKNDNGRCNSMNSPWGTSISPRTRQRSGKTTTVQTSNGPLLSSTRYNIDSKTSTDVKSAGLTSRLAKYATKVNSKLVLQSHYGTGQLSSADQGRNPSLLIDTMIEKSRKPVRVKIAPPKTHYSALEWQKKLSDVWRLDSSIINSLSNTYALKEISLKRHASRDDVAELIKKQRRTGSYFSDELKNLKEMTQKRARDESSNSGGDISIEKSLVRQVKRIKKPSCHDVINSLSSSSIHGFSIKRKADLSHSNSDSDTGKYSKSVKKKESSGLNESNISSTISIGTGSPTPSSRPCPSIEFEIRQDNIFEDTQNQEITNYVPMSLKDRLFMRPESDDINELKTSVKERCLTPKFPRSGTDEIRKSDIVNMRQISVKAKLKSMFDAISGIGSSQIDPNIVIRAEEIDTVAVASNQFPIFTILNSVTTTTNMNTSPISTSAIAPFIRKIEELLPHSKQVAFSLSTVTSSGTNRSVSTSLNEKHSGLRDLKDYSEEVEKFDSTKPPLISCISTNISSSVPILSSDSSELNSRTSKSVSIALNSPTCSIELSGNAISTHAASNSQKNYGAANVLPIISTSVEETVKLIQSGPTLIFNTSISSNTSSTSLTPRNSTSPGLEGSVVQSLQTEITKSTTQSTASELSSKKASLGTTPISSFGVPTEIQSIMTTSYPNFASPTFPSESTTTSSLTPTLSVTSVTFPRFKIKPTMTSTSPSSPKFPALPKVSFEKSSTSSVYTANSRENLLSLSSATSAITYTNNHETLVDTMLPSFGIAGSDNSKMSRATSDSLFGRNNIFDQSKFSLAFKETAPHSGISSNSISETSPLSKSGEQSATNSNIFISNLDVNSTKLASTALNITASFETPGTTTPTFLNPKNYASDFEVLNVATSSSEMFDTSKSLLAQQYQNLSNAGLVPSSMSIALSNSFRKTIPTSSGNSCIVVSPFAGTITSFPSIPSTTESTALSSDSAVLATEAPCSKTLNLASSRNREGDEHRFDVSQMHSKSNFSIQAIENTSGTPPNVSAPSFEFGSIVGNGFNFCAASNSATPGTFSFSLPAPAEFGRNTGGMFSIGTGSTAPRSRTARQRRQQR